jgi:hypothetical protein
MSEGLHIFRENKADLIGEPAEPEGETGQQEESS